MNRREASCRTVPRRRSGKLEPHETSTDRGLLETVVNQSADGLVVISSDGVVQFANPAAYDLLSGRTEELQGFHLGTPAIREPTQLVLPKCDELLHVEMRASEIVWRGEPATLASLRDVTEAMRIRESLQERVKELRCLSDLSRCVEQAAANGLSTSELLDCVSRILPPAFLHPESAVGRVRFQGESFETGPFASCVSTLTAGIPLFGGIEGAIEVGYLKAHRPQWQGPFLQEEQELLDLLAERLGLVLEQRRAVADLRESERKYRLLAENTLDVIWAWDEDLKCSYVSPAVETLTGRPPQDFLGECLRDLQGEPFPEYLRWVEEEILKGPSRAAGSILETDLLAGDGSKVAVEIQGKALFDDDGAFVRHVSVVRDVSSRKALEERLRQAQKLESVGQLAGGVAHDFNNMLGVILGNVELALEEELPNDEVRESLHEIFDASTRASHLTRQLLAFARKQTIEPRVLDLNDTIASMIKMLGRLISESIRLVWKPGDDLWCVHMDPGQVDQILANLLVNARDAIDGVGEIAIETSNEMLTAAEVAEIDAAMPPGSYVVLSVRDDGAGMDPATLARVFEPFFTTKAVGEGTGLGLSTVYGIVKQHGGYLDAESEPGRGTEFHIYLPGCSEAADEACEEDVSTLPEGTETILVVEDEASVLRMSGRMLERLGYTVLSAPGPSAALRIARDHAGRIDLLMTDVVMPEMSGWDLCAELTELPDLKSLFVSGYSADILATGGVLRPGIHFLRKPFDSRSLAVKLREVLDS